MARNRFLHVLALGAYTIFAQVASAPPAAAPAATTSSNAAQAHAAPPPLVSTVPQWAQPDFEWRGDV